MLVQAISIIPVHMSSIALQQSQHRCHRRRLRISIRVGQLLRLNPGWLNKDILIDHNFIKDIYLDNKLAWGTVLEHLKSKDKRHKKCWLHLFHLQHHKIQIHLVENQSNLYSHHLYLLNLSNVLCRRPWIINNEGCLLKDRDQWWDHQKHRVEGWYHNLQVFFPTFNSRLTFSHISKSWKLNLHQYTLNSVCSGIHLRQHHYKAHRSILQLRQPFRMTLTTPSTQTQP